MKIVQIGVLVAVIALIVLFILGYIFNWAWIGVGPYISSNEKSQRSKLKPNATLHGTTNVSRLYRRTLIVCRGFCLRRICGSHNQKMRYAR